MNLENAKKALVDFQMKHESYLDAAQKYQEYKNLPFWKRMISRRVEAPRRSYLYEAYPVYTSRRKTMYIEMRMYFSGTYKEITLAINEGNRGYKVNVDTGEKSYYLGRVNPEISIAAEEILEDIRKELASLYVE